MRRANLTARILSQPFTNYSVCQSRVYFSLLILTILCNAGSATLRASKAREQIKEVDFNGNWYDVRRAVVTACGLKVQRWTLTILWRFILSWFCCTEWSTEFYYGNTSILLAFERFDINNRKGSLKQPAWYFSFCVKSSWTTLYVWFSPTLIAPPSVY